MIIIIYKSITPLNYYEFMYRQENLSFDFVGLISMGQTSEYLFIINIATIYVPKKIGNMQYNMKETVLILLNYISSKN